MSKKTLKNEALENIREDRKIIKKFLKSLSDSLEISKEKGEEELFHFKSGKLVVDYVFASVKNNEQLINILKIKDKEVIEEEMTNDDIDNVYSIIESGEK